MSLAAKKDALFGGGGGNTTAKPAPSTQTAAGNNNTKPKSTLPPRKATSTVSAAVKAEKTQEAKQLVAEGEEYLKTSLFKWQPDYMGAAPKFSGASKAYAVAGDAALAHDMMLKSSKAYLGYDSTSAAANTLQEAAKLATTPQQKMEDLAAAAELWGQSGDVSRMAMTYVSVAETEGASEEEAAENLQVACNILVPPDSTEQDLTNIYSRGEDARKGHEVLQKAFKFFLTAKAPPRLEDAMKTGVLLCRVSAAMNSDSVLWKTQAAITVLQLHGKDVIAAEQTYIQEHLARAGYASSKEAEVVDELISAYRACDEEQLAAVQRSRGLFYLDREVKDLVLRLSLTGSKKEEEKRADADAHGGAGGDCAADKAVSVSAAEITTEITHTQFEGSLPSAGAAGAPSGEGTVQQQQQQQQHEEEDDDDDVDLA